LAGQAYKRVEKRLAGNQKLTTDAGTSARMSRVRQHGTVLRVDLIESARRSGW